MRTPLMLMLLIVLILPGVSGLERGIKAADIEDVILVGGSDWHGAVAATPLAVWSEDGRTVTNPLLILPREVMAGDRIGWVEAMDIERYGVVPVLHALASANISAVVIHADGDLAKDMVKAAQKEGIKAYVTATLEPPAGESLSLNGISNPSSLDQEEVLRDLPRYAKALFFEEMGLTQGESAQRDVSWQQVSRLNPDLSADLFCPVNPEASEYLFDKIEVLVEEYKVDGIVLYDFGFEGDDYCFCQVCKDEFYRDTGIDLTKISSSRYNMERWKAWREEKVLEIAREARNITTDLGPVELGVALKSPLDRSQGYSYQGLSQVADFVILSPITPEEVNMASLISETPFYVRLANDYVEHTISTQNVEGAVTYIEDLIERGATGMAFEYNVVYTPLWSELEPPTASARWLLDTLDGKTLGIGDVSWNCSARIDANNSYEMAALISQRWESSPGAVLVGENYSNALKGSVLASYLNWPLLFVGEGLSDETASALKRLGATEVVSYGPLSSRAKEEIARLNLTVIPGESDLLFKEMGDADMIVMANSLDRSLISPSPKSEIRRCKVGDILVSTEMSSGRIPSDRAGEIVRLNITLTNLGDEAVEELSLVDLFPAGRYIGWYSPSQGEVELTDPLDGDGYDVEAAFFEGSLLLWKVGTLEEDESASLNLDVEILHPLDAGWVQPLESGMTISHKGLRQNVTTGKAASWPITNVTYPLTMPVGIAKITWSVEKTPDYTGIVMEGPDGWVGRVEIDDCAPDRLYQASVPLPKPGNWTFFIEAGNGYYHSTENLTIQVRSSIRPLNVTAFSHTIIPRLSMVAPQLAAARRALIYDVARDPQNIDPIEVEEEMNEWIKDLDLTPSYLAVVGDPGSMPFISTGLDQTNSASVTYEIYRDYRIIGEDDNYTETAVGRVLGLSVYDASQMVARTLAYDRLAGDWKDRSLVISTPSEWPWNPIPLRIGEYLAEAGFDVRNLNWEEATSQLVTSLMSNGENVVLFDHHSNERSWGLSYWSMIDSALDETQVKQLVLAPQTTTTNSCLSARLKGYTIEVGGTDMYVPARLDDSMALAFIRAGAVNYLGAVAYSWIFISDDYPKRFYQALVYENATVGQAMLRADDLYLMKMKRVESLGNLDRVEEGLPKWDYSVSEMLNQTAKEFMLLGDPSFRPAMTEAPRQPFEMEANVSGEEAKVSIEPLSEIGTDWLYWIDLETTDGKLMLNAPPVLIGEVALPQDSEEVVVKENGRAIWHDEDIQGEDMLVSWPVVRPRLGERRDFTVEFKVVPGQVQVINVTSGWNMVSLYLNPRDATLAKYLKKKPYRGIFTITDKGWRYTLWDSDVSNLTTLEPGQGYLIDSSEGFTIEIPGKPVELPYRLKLHSGWNMIGVPLNETYLIGNITVNAEHKRYSYSEAVEKGMISAFLWAYEDEGEWSYLGESDSMIPGRSYLIEARDDCQLEFN